MYSDKDKQDSPVLDAIKDVISVFAGIGVVLIIAALMVSLWSWLRSDIMMFFYSLTR